jgi:hypothetical protein
LFTNFVVCVWAAFHDIDVSFSICFSCLDNFLLCFVVIGIFFQQFILIFLQKSDLNQTIAQINLQKYIMELGSSGLDKEVSKFQSGSYQMKPSLDDTFKVC